MLSAGSLLGVATNRQQYSFPVGKINEMNMYSLDFEEFLWAMGKKKLAEEIKDHYKNDETMPEAVVQFIKTDSFVKIQPIQNNILHEYIADMAKYADLATSIKIRACYNSISAQLSKENTKFQYKVVQRGGTATIFGEAIECLFMQK
ncbi:MAG: hypothetical protein RR034_03280 [Bacteroidales bacterium]